MKKLLIACMATLVLAGFPARAQPVMADADIVILGNYYFPQDDDLWDNGWGAELQVRFWICPMFGLAIAGGYSQWDVNENNFTVGPGGFLEAELDGEIDMVPVGASILLRPINTKAVSLVLEGGARYVFIDSDAHVRVAGSRHTPGTKHSVDVDDAVIALAMATLEFDLTEDVFVTVGGGYQWDVDKGDVNFLDEDLGNLELEGAIVQAGFGFRF